MEEEVCIAKTKSILEVEIFQLAHHLQRESAETVRMWHASLFLPQLEIGLQLAHAKVQLYVLPAIVPPGIPQHDPV